MKRFYLLILITVLVIALVVISVVFKKEEKNDDKTLKIAVQTNGGVPYKWEYEIEDESIIKYVKTKEIENDNKDGKVGAKVVLEFHFKGLKKGSTTIKLKYVSITDNTVAEENVYKATVDKDLKIEVAAMDTNAYDKE